jgi:type VI protein secretion system component Hcp
MAKRVTTNVNRNRRRAQDLAVKSARAVKGGATPKLMVACATGEHIKEATITVR